MAQTDKSLPKQGSNDGQADDSSSKQKQRDEHEMSLLDHLRELRRRIIWSLLMILLIFLVLFYFRNELYSYVAQPLLSLHNQGSSMIAIDVTSPFFAPFKLALIAAVFVAMPVLLYQLWSFIAPGLYSRERVVFVYLIISSIFLFYLGLVFAYYVVMPLITQFFTQIGPSNIAVMTDINSYLSFVIKIFFAFGVAFEIPVAIVLLSLAGLVNPTTLQRKRRYVIVSCFIAGMLLTPPDIFSQTLLALPMWLLFEVGILCARFLLIKKLGEQSN